MSLRIIILLSFTSINLLVVAILLLAGGDSPEPVNAGNSEIENVANAKAKPATATSVFDDRIRPFMAKHCYGCHGPEKQKADFSLHQFTSAKDLIKHRRTWQNVAKMVRSHEMPPKKGTPPTPEDRTFFFEWIEKTLDEVDCSELRHPGRVTIRRLNRVEYNNTIRDLLDIKFKPAEDFPDDDVGYGFDHIGDVLTLPPVLLEKYLAAAEKIAETAVGQETGSGGAVQAFEAKQLGGGQGWDNNARSLTSTGEVFRDVDFPETGEYEIIITAYEKAGGDEASRMGLTVNKDKLFVFEVKNNSRSPQDFAFRAKVEKGKRRVGAHFLNDFYEPGHRDPNKRDRNLYIRKIAVRGPIVDRPSGGRNRIFVTWPKDEKDTKRAAIANLKQLARRAYRRPVTDDEVNKLYRFVELVEAEEGSFKEGMQLAVTAMLVSPHFLFRVEKDPTDANKDGVRMLDNHELATRLSYFLWSSLPDAELSKLADDGKLRDSIVLARQIDGMLNDPKAVALVENFGGQWLQLRSLERVAPDKRKFAAFNDDLREAMLRETELFFKSVITEDRSVLDFIDAPFTFVNERLAKHYGIDNVKGDAFQKVNFDSTAAKERGGILTHASILTITSNATRTNPVLRGKYVLDNILGTPPPPPPPDVPELEEGDEAALEGSLRERMEHHRDNPVCASCHQRMDPIGFGFENYDAIGRWRTRDGKHPIDPAGALPDGQSFKSPAELKSIIRSKKELFVRNLAEKMLTYALGRGLEYYDKCAVDDIVAAMRRNDYRFSSMIVAIVHSEPFQKRARMLPDDENDQ